MKTRRTILCGLFAVIAAFTLAFTACDDGTGGGDNTDPKTLVITLDLIVLPQGSSFFAGVYPVGTDLDELYNSPPTFIAGSYKSTHGITSDQSIYENGLVEYIVTAPLYTHADARWTGSGTYDLYVRITQNNNQSFYKRSVNISSATTVTKISQSFKVTP